MGKLLSLSVPQFLCLPGQEGRGLEIISAKHEHRTGLQEGVNKRQALLIHVHHL